MYGGESDREDAGKRGNGKGNVRGSQLSLLWMRRILDDEVIHYTQRK